MRSTLLQIARPSLLALRTYWKPFVLIQVCGLAVVMLYFGNASVRDAADILAAYKTAGGLWAAALASAVSGALLPEIGKAIALGDTRMTRRRLDDFAVHVGLFAVLGVMADLFYTLLSRLLGDGPHLGAVAAKVAADQLIYSTTCTLPFVAFVFTWRGCGWSLSRTTAQLGRAWYLRRVIPLLVPCWFFWIPMATLMYALPLPLTFCFAMFAQAAWGLLMVFVAQHANETEQPAPIITEPYAEQSPTPTPPCASEFS